METRLLLGRICLNLYLYIIPIDFEILLHKWLMRTLNINLSSMNTPENFPEDSHAAGQLFISPAGKSSSSELHTVVTSPILSSLKMIVVSSANRKGEIEFDILGESFTYNKNKSGQGDLPTFIFAHF